MGDDSLMSVIEVRSRQSTQNSASHSKLSDTVKILRKERNILQNELLWREIQVDWILRNFPSVVLPQELAKSPEFTDDTGMEVIAEFVTSPRKTQHNPSPRKIPRLSLTSHRLVIAGRPNMKVDPTKLVAFDYKPLTLVNKLKMCSVSRLVSVNILPEKNGSLGAILASLSKLREEIKGFAISSAQLNSVLPEITECSRKHAQILSVAISQKTQGSLNMELDLIRGRWLKEVALRRQLHNELQEIKGNVRVFCRIRPVPVGETDVVNVRDDETLEILGQYGIVKEFNFDRVFAQDKKNSQIAAEIAPFVISVLDGYHVCVFAYGQTGAGKSYSMGGTPGDPGVYYTSFVEIFKQISERISCGWKYFDVGLSVIEIYNDEVRDLIARDVNTVERSLPLKMNPLGSGFSVPGLTIIPVRGAEEAMETIQRGSKNRVTGHHALNAQSSRSHLLVQLRLSVSPPSVQIRGEKKNLIPASLSLIDLAGSERLDRTNACGETAKEGIFINKSLSALGDVINAKCTKAAHIPFRNSILTSLLQENLSADAKTLMLLQINPSGNSYDESCNSMVFGTRVSSVETRYQATKTSKRV